MEDNGEWGLIDQDGQILIEPKYPQKVFFSDGLAGVTEDRQTKYLDRSGNTALSLPYGFGLDFNQGRAIVMKDPMKDTRSGVIDKDGQWIVEPAYVGLMPFSEGRAFGLSNDGETIIIDFSGNVKKPPLCGGTFYSEGLASGSKNCDLPLGKRKYGFIDFEGNWIISPRYELPSFFNNGMASVKLNGKFGFIDKSGNIRVKPVYDRAGKFSDGLAPVGMNNLNALNPSEDGTNRSFAELKERTQKVGRFGYINADGEVVIDFKFHAASEFNEGLGKVTLNGKTGFINTQGKIVVPLIFDDAGDFENGYAQVEFSGRQYYVTRDGIPIGFKLSEVGDSAP